MRELFAEILLRLSKVVAATVVGAIVYLVLVGPVGASASVELAVLAWLAGAAFILLVETSPI
jgi:hypothetical protein